MESGRLRILGSGQNLVDLTPVSNLVDAIVLSLEVSEKSTQHIYHISNGKPVSMWKAIAYVLQALGYEAPKRKIPLSLAMGAARVMEGWAKLRGVEQEPTLLPYSVGCSIWRGIRPAFFCASNQESAAKLLSLKSHSEER